MPVPLPRPRAVLLLFALAVALLLAAALSSSAMASAGGSLYTQTNDPSGNAITVLGRHLTVRPPRLHRQRVGQHQRLRDRP